MFRTLVWLSKNLSFFPNLHFAFARCPAILCLHYCHNYGKYMQVLHAAKYSQADTRLRREETSPWRTKWQTLRTLSPTESRGTRGIPVCYCKVLSARYLTEIFVTAATLKDGLRAAETAVEDVFIRRFMTGTWHDLFCSEVIIKRQHNMIRIAGLIRQNIPARKMYFLIGYCEELLSNWLQCPVILELQTITKKEDTYFKFI